MNRNQKIALGVGGGLLLFGTAVFLWRRSAAAANIADDATERWRT